MRFASQPAFLFAIHALTACAAGPNADPDRREARLRGRVVAARSQPIGGARVTLLRSSGIGLAQVGQVTADAEGSFAFTDLVPGRFQVRASMAHHFPAVVPVDLRPGDDVTSTLNLEPEQQLQGRVEDWLGRPLPWATVLAWPAGSQGETPALETTTAIDGTFALTGLARGTWRILVEAPGFAAFEVGGVAVPSRFLSLRVDGESHSPTGMVSGPVVGGVRILLTGASLRRPREILTDDVGRFTFLGLGPGVFTFRAVAGRIASLPSTLTIMPQASALPLVRLILLPGGFAEGRVRDETGRALPGARVEVEAAGWGEFGDWGASDATGWFSIGPLPAGKYRVGARLAGYTQPDLDEIRVRSVGTSAIDLKIVRGAQVSGRVLKQNRQPVAGAAVLFVGAIQGASDDLPVVTGSLPLAAEAAQLFGPALQRGGRVRRVTSDAQGRFQLGELPPGQARVDVAYGTDLFVRVSPLLLGAGDVRDLGDLELVTRDRGSP